MRNIIKLFNLLLIVSILVACVEESPMDSSSDITSRDISDNDSRSETMQVMERVSETPMEQSEIVKITFKDGRNAKIKNKDGVQKIYTADKSVYTIARSGNQIHLKDSNSNTIYTAYKDGDRVTVKQNNKTLWDFKTDGAKTKFYYQGQFTFRTKIKADKINVYDSDGNRTGKCKRKDYGYRLNDSSGRRLKKIQGNLTDEQVIYFCSPLSLEIASLVWNFSL